VKAFHVVDQYYQCTAATCIFLHIVFSVWSFGRHNMDSLALRQCPRFPLELLNVYENDKLKVGESWEGYEAFCE